MVGSAGYHIGLFACVWPLGVELFADRDDLGINNSQFFEVFGQATDDVLLLGIVAPKFSVLHSIFRQLPQGPSIAHE